MSVTVLAAGFVAVLALVVFRPTPIAGFDGDDLAASVNGGGPFSSAFTPCKRAGDVWRCEVVYDSGSSWTTYRVEDPDWWGCWTAERAREYPGPDPEKAFGGCISILDHF